MEPVPSKVDLLIRLLVATALGGAVGLEREIRDQPAGFRTHILVAVGACLFTIVSAYGFEEFFDTDDQRYRLDPSRVAAQIVTGIGFLGAGAILRYGMTVRGLTTAASLWVVAAIGMAIALGGYFAATVATVIVLISLWVLKPVRRVLVRGFKREHEEFQLAVTTDMQLDELVRELREASIRVDNVRMETEEGETRVVLYLRLPPDYRPEAAVALMSRVPGVRNVDWTR